VRYVGPSTPKARMCRGAGEAESGRRLRGNYGEVRQPEVFADARLERPITGISCQICLGTLYYPNLAIEPPRGLNTLGLGTATESLGGTKTMSKPLRTLGHELNTWAPEVALAFYHRTLGWEFEHTLMPDGDSYWIAHPSGRPVGGTYALRQPDYQGIPSHWMTYLAVADIVQAERTAVFAGGEVCRPTVSVPGVSKHSIVSDSTGAIIGFI